MIKKNKPIEFTRRKFTLNIITSYICCKLRYNPHDSIDSKSDRFTSYFSFEENVCEKKT